MPGFGWIRNPLTIIAIFISLIYGIASLLFGVSVGKLTPENQTLLVYFVICFPIGVLGVFSWLVTKHHHKLYGPGDYKSDDTFARTFPTATPNEVLEKRKEEVKDLESTAPQLLPVPNDRVKGDVPSAADRFDAYILESLVIQELQASESGSVRREVRIGRQIVDCVIESPAGLTFVEIKALSENNWYLFSALQQAGRTLHKAVKAAGNDSPPLIIKTMAVLVLWQTLPQDELDREMSRLPPEERPDSIRILYRQELLSKYRGYISKPV
ncbi:MAG: hypothetical protein U1E61_06350 [Bradyrhizobium sp.]